MNESERPSEKKWFILIRKAVRGLGEGIFDLPQKYWHYLFVVSIIIISLSILALLNAYLNFVNMSSYDLNLVGGSSPLLLAGYLGMFISIALSPVPDYFLVPAYGYLSSIGVFDPYTTFWVCLAGAVFPIEYLAGRFAGRPLLLKSLSYVKVSEKTLESAEKWLVEHGRFSIFTSTFIPFFYTVTSLAAGILKMNAATFLLASSVGFGLRFAFLEYIGSNSVYIFTASFDYSQRTLLILLLVSSSLYAALYLIGASRSKRKGISS